MQGIFRTNKAARENHLHAVKGQVEALIQIPGQDGWWCNSLPQDATKDQVIAAIKSSAFFDKPKDMLELIEKLSKAMEATKEAQAFFKLSDKNGNGQLSRCLKHKCHLPN